MPSFFQFKHHVSPSSLVESALSGCCFCSRLWQKLSPSIQDYLTTATFGEDGKQSILPVTTASLFFDPIEDNGIPQNLELWNVEVLFLNLYVDLTSVVDDLPTQSKENLTFKKTFRLYPTIRSEFLLDKPPRSDTTASEEVFHLAKTWLEKCQRSHKRCNRNIWQGAWYPTRLIDVGVGDKPEEIYLVVTADSELEGNYVTLSHCWGDSQPLRLQSTNIQDLKRGIKLDTLPLTYQHAVSFSRRLGIRYLWIDSLCILQDDSADWLYESALMHKVYSQSFCNISATAGKNGNTGLFSSRDPATLIPDKIYVGRDPKAKFDMQQYFVYDPDHWDSHVLQTPLNRRGWVLQERLLAPRVLHFGSQQVAWECSQMDATETFPRRFPRDLATGGFFMFKGLNPKVDGKRARETHIRRLLGKLSLSPELGDMLISPDFYPYALWTRIVHTYSRSLLTKAEDKLIALSGIARKIQTVVNDEYVAGLWRRHLASELLWCVEDQEQVDHQPAVRPTQYRAPSFSWASIDGKVNAGLSVREGILISIDHIQLNHVSEDIFGLVQSGHLLVTGPLKRLHLRLPKRITDGRTAPSDAPSSSLLESEWRTTIASHTFTQQALDEEPQIRLFYDTAQDNPTTSATDDPPSTYNTFCLPIAQNHLPGSTYRLDCLLLEHTEHDHESIGTFRRVGLARAFHSELIQYILKKDLDADETPLPCRNWDPESGLYTISLC